MSSDTSTDHRPDAATDYEAEHGPYVAYTPPQPAPGPAPVKATIKLDPPAPRPGRPRWTLGARLTVAVLVVVLAGVVIASMLVLRHVAATATQVGQQAASEQTELTAMGKTLTALQAKVNTPAPVFHLPARLAHYGLCFSFGRNTGNGDLVDVNVTTPTMTAGQYSCGAGSFVSAVPAP